MGTKRAERTPEEIREYVLARLRAEGPTTQKALLKGLSTWWVKGEYSKVIDALLDEGVIEIISRKPAFSNEGGPMIGFKHTKYALARRTA